MLLSADNIDKPRLQGQLSMRQQATTTSDRYKGFILTSLLAIGFLLAFGLLSYLSIVPEVEHRNLHDDDKNGQLQMDNLHQLMLSKHQAIELWRERLIAAEKQKLKGLVTMVSDLIESESQLSLHANHHEFLQALRKLRFDRTNYFWVVDQQGYTLSHPDDRFNHQSLDDLGKRLPAHIIKSIFDTHYDIRDRTLDGELEGFSSYEWTNPQDGSPVRKSMYYLYLPERKWYVMSAYYEDKIEDEIANYRQLAMDEIQDHIADYRFGKNGYFAGVDSNKRIVFHPSSDLIGQVMANTDPHLNLEHIYQLILANADSGKPFVYDWPKNRDEPEHKTSKVAWARYFEPFDIYLASTIELKELNANSTFITTRLLLIVAVGAMLSLIAAHVFQLRGSYARKRQEAETARAANDAKSLFIAQMSHEIRTPLNGVIGALELVQTSALDASNRRLINIMRRSSDTLMALINDILDFSKADAGKIELKPTQFNLIQWLETVVQNYQAEANLKNIDFNVDTNINAGLEITTDPLRLRQILGNLLNNAIKFTDAGHVNLTVDWVENNGEPRLRFAINDTGIGIAREQQQDLFEVFTQADPSTTRIHGGTGLGLAICKSLVALFQGSIDFSSDENSGATFWFTIPIQNYQFTSLTKPAPQGFAFINNNDALPPAMINELIALGGTLDDTQPDHLRQPLLWFTNSINAIELAGLAAQNPGRLLHVFSTESAGDVIVPESIALHLMPAVARALLLELPEILAHEKIAPTPRQEDLTARRYLALIAEDNQVNALILTRMLSNTGIDNILTTDGKKAVDTYKDKHASIDLIVLDLEMPIYDGKEAARLIRQYEVDNQLERKPIIMLSAHAGLLDQQCGEIIDMALSKPLEGARLKDCLSALGLVVSSVP